MPLGRGAGGLVVRSLSVADFGNVAGETEVGQSDLAIGAAASYPLLESLHAGAGVKLVRSSLADHDASGFAGDLGLRQALAENGRMPSARELRNRAEAWRPWRGYAAFWLWRQLATRSAAP